MLPYISIIQGLIFEYRRPKSFQGHYHKRALIVPLYHLVSLCQQHTFWCKRRKPHSIPKLRILWVLVPVCEAINMIQCRKHYVLCKCRVDYVSANVHDVMHHSSCRLHGRYIIIIIIVTVNPQGGGASWALRCIFFFKYLKIIALL